MLWQIPVHLFSVFFLVYHIVCDTYLNLPLPRAILSVHLYINIYGGENGDFRGIRVVEGTSALSYLLLDNKLSGILVALLYFFLQVYSSDRFLWKHLSLLHRKSFGISKLQLENPFPRWYIHKPGILSVTAGWEASWSYWLLRRYFLLTCVSP